MVERGKLSFCILSLIIIVGVLGFASSATLTVQTTSCEGIVNCYNSIQSAITAATNDGDTIEVYSGTYNENLIIDENNLTVKAIGNAIIQSSVASKWLVLINAEKITFEGFELIGDRNTNWGVRTEKDNTTIKNNKIRNVITGIQTTSAPIGKNKILGNQISNAQVGISLQNDYNIIIGNILTNISGGGFGIASFNTTFENNQITVGDNGCEVRISNANAVNPPDEKYQGSIQDGINAANPGDVVCVNAGMYNERITINKPLTLRGATYNVNKNGYSVPANYEWNTSIESVINNPEPALNASQVVDIVSDDVVFEGFVVQSLNALPAPKNANDHLVRLDATTGNSNEGFNIESSLDNITIRNNIIGPNTNLTSQTGTSGRMGLYFASPTYLSDETGITNTIVTGNKIIDALGNGNNVFVWGAAKSYSSPKNADYTGTIIEGNEISGSHRSGIEVSGGVSNLIIRNNWIHNQSSTNGGSTSSEMKYGNGIIFIRMGSDKTYTNAMGSENILIENNLIENNEKNGIYFGPFNKNIIIKNNTFLDNNNSIQVDLTEVYHPNNTNVFDKILNIIATYNKIFGNLSVIGTPTNGFVLDAKNNYWGTNTPNFENLIFGNVDYNPWYNEDFTTQYFEINSTTGEAEYDEEGVGGITINPEGEGTEPITIQIESLTESEVVNEESVVGVTSIGKFVSIESSVSNENIEEVEIRVYYTEPLPTGITENKLRLYYYNTTSLEWVPAATELGKFGVNTTGNYVWAITNHLSDYGIFGDITGPTIGIPTTNPEFVSCNYKGMSPPISVLFGLSDPSGVNNSRLYWTYSSDPSSTNWRTPAELSEGIWQTQVWIPEVDVNDGVLVRYNIYATDNLGNERNTGYSDLFTYDCLHPTTTDNASTTWTNESVTIQLTCDDSISNCNKTYYSYDGSAPTILYDNTPFTLSETGTYQLRYYSIDNAGNSEEEVEGTLVRIDKTIPTSSDNYLFNDEWMNASQTISLSNDSDGLSPVTIKYCLTSGCTPDTDYSSAVTISSEGTNYLGYQAVDEAGNIESSVHEKIVKIDKTIPSTSHDAPTGWQNETFIITLDETTDDGLSDVTTYYKIWNVEGTEPINWTEGTSIPVNTDGEYNIKYYSEDEAGNVETVKELSVQLDMTNPIVTIDEVTTPTNIATQTVTGTFTETNIANITVNGIVANKTSGTYSAEIPLLEGNHSINVIATDFAGNSGNVNSWIVLDTVAPTISVAIPASNGTLVDNMDSYRVEADADDSLSGIKKVKLTLLNEEENIVENLENTNMKNGTYGYEYLINMWQLESGVYTLIINATDKAGNYAYDIRTFVVVDNVATSRTTTINGTVSAETGGTVTFRFNVTARGEDGIKFGMNNIGVFSPSALNARISEDGITFADVGGFDGANIVNAETLYLTDLNSELSNIQGSFVLYLDVPANMTPGTYPITYYIDN